VREFAHSYFEAFESFQITPERILDAGDRIVADCRLSGLGRSSGVAVENLPTHIWTLRAGKAVRLEVFPAREKP
jgi:ketosteroid isomerase-like protein